MSQQLHSSGFNLVIHLQKDTKISEWDVPCISKIQENNIPLQQGIANKLIVLNRIPCVGEKNVRSVDGDVEKALRCIIKWYRRYALHVLLCVSNSYMYFTRKIQIKNYRSREMFSFHFISSCAVWKFSYHLPRFNLITVKYLFKYIICAYVYMYVYIWIHIQTHFWKVIFNQITWKDLPPIKVAQPEVY